MTLAIRGRGDSHDLEIRQDGTANALVTPNGGRAGIGCGAVAIPLLEVGARTGVSTTDVSAGSGIGENGDPMFTLQSGKQHAVAFDTTQITSAGNYSSPRAGDPCHPLAADAHPPAVAFDWSVSESQSMKPGVATPPLKSGHPPAAQTGMAVRRLTPRECEKLQGFEPDYTLIPWRGGLASDGPRYKALGNSMAVPCMAYIGRRMLAVDAEG